MTHTPSEYISPAWGCLEDRLIEYMAAHHIDDFQDAFEALIWGEEDTHENE